MELIIREMHEFEYLLLRDFLYEAIFQRDAEDLLPKTIINEPSLQKYIQDFGSKKDDYCLCAEIDKKVVGVVWVRDIEGFGNIGDGIPEFSMSIYKEYRGRGIGTKLMKQMLVLLKDKGYLKVSLSVQKDNYALDMYRKLGFIIAIEKEEEYIMEYNVFNKTSY